MPPHLRLATTHRARELGHLIEQARRLRDANEHQSIELRLAIMQARIRIAELKATLRTLQPYR